MENIKIFTIKVDDGITRFPSSKLLYISISGYLATFHLEGKKSISKTISLKHLEEDLDTSFFRINRNIIINLLKVQRFTRKKREVILSTDYDNSEEIHLQVSTRRVKAFLRALIDSSDALMQ